MPTDIIMPKLDLTMAEGVLLQWLKKDGDEVKKGEPIAVIETAKVTYEIEAPTSGILRIIKPEGSVIPVLEKIGYILEPSEEIAREAARAEKIKASPLAKKIAKQYNIDISKIKGTGPGGFITKDDVLSYVEKVSLHVKEQSVVKPYEEEEIIPLTGWRKTMCDRMSYSVRTAAQITTIAEVDATELVELREKLKNEKGIDITYTAFIVKAVVKALQEFPIINSSLVDDKIVVKKYYNIGIAVEREDRGLIVPVIRNAEKLSLYQIADRLKVLVEKARAGKLTIEEVTGGTFTITNPGMMGVIMNTPVINPPESAILGVGAIKKRPVVKDDQVTIRWMMYLCLTYDHRIVDGAPAIRFLQRVRSLIENPSTLLD